MEESLTAINEDLQLAKARITELEKMTKTLLTILAQNSIIEWPRAYPLLNLLEP